MDLRPILDRIDALKAEIDALRPIDAEQEGRVMQMLRLDWNYHSNAIEGNTLTLGETRAFLLHGITAKGKPFRDYLDIKGHNEAIAYLEQLVRGQEQLTEVVIRELHRILLVEPYDVDAVTPDGRPTRRRIAIGQYKTASNHLRTSTGEVHYYAMPEETPAQMGDLMAWYRSETESGALHPLLLAATFHYRFVAIHPFDDGNGRMARLLMNLLLMQYGYVPIVIRLESRGDYLLALETADAGDLVDFVMLVGEALLRSLELYLKAARRASLEEPGAFEQQVLRLHEQLAPYDA
jgi:Fic family protein